MSKSTPIGAAPARPSCPSSKKSKPEWADHPVLFVQLDVTDSTLTSQARLLAAALSVEDHFKANNQTGLVLLINAEDHTLLETVTKQNSAAEIVGAKSKPTSAAPEQVTD